MSDGEKIGVLFVCMGNICRSPMAEGVFLKLIDERGVATRFDVDSAGTGGWHAGEPADGRARATASGRGVELTSRARRIAPPDDWRRFHHIIVMDADNHAGVLAAGAPRERVRLLRAFDPEAGGADPPGVPDPYYGGPEGFEDVFDMVERSCTRLLDEILDGPRR